MTLATAIHTRVFKAVGLSLLMHAALLAGWRQAVALPQLAAFEPIEVALLGEPAPRKSVAPRLLPVAATQPRPAETAPVADDTITGTTSATQSAGEAAASDEPLVEARSDVASLDNPKPPYPLAARRRGIEGRVLLTAHVRADGGCADVRLKQSSGSSLLDHAALNSVRHWRFVPAQRGDTAIDSWVDVPVSFRLEG